MAKFILILLKSFKELFKRLGPNEAMMKLEGCWQAGAQGLVGECGMSLQTRGVTLKGSRGERGETERRAELANVSGMKS